jgi:hypothetical protein
MSYRQWMLIRNLRLPSPTWWSSNYVQGHQDLIRAFTITTASSEGSWSSRLPRCCQSPRVTSYSLHLSRIEHQERISQLNLLASTWILMTWQVEWWWNILLVALKHQECVFNIWRVERAKWKTLGAYIDSKFNRAVGEKAVRKSNNAGQTGDVPLLMSV